MSMPPTSGPKVRRRNARWPQAAVEVDRRHDRLERVGQERELLRSARPGLAGPHLEKASDPERPGLGREHGGRNQVGLDLRERALLEVRKRAVDQLADDEAEHGVAEELEPLVVGGADLAVFVREGLVRQRPLEQVRGPGTCTRAAAESRRPPRSPARDRSSGLLVVPEAGLEPARAFRPSGF